MIDRGKLLDTYDLYYIDQDTDQVVSVSDLDDHMDHNYLYIDGNDNIIRLTEDQDIVFMRFDSIATAKELYDYDASVDLDNDVFAKLDYEIKYAKDRADFICELLDNNNDLITYLSSYNAISKQHKHKNSLRSEDQIFDGKLEKIADYILYPKYDDKDDEEYHISLKEQYQKLQSMPKKTEEIETTIYKLRSELDLIQQKILSRSKQEKNRYREELIKDIERFEFIGELEGSFDKEKMKKTRIGKKLDVNCDYWSSMGFSKEGAKFRQEVIQVYEDSIGRLERQLGYDKKKNEQLNTQKKLLNSLEPIEFTIEGKLVTITPEMRLDGIKKIYSELVSDYYTAKGILAEVISFSQIKPSSTVYDFNMDTWYENENGDIVELSRNTILFSNPNTYKGLLTTYYDLYEKHKDNFNSDIWAILHDFRGLIEKADLTEEERFVVDRLMQDESRKSIIQGFLEEFHKDLSDKVLSTWINRTIPNKIVQAYLLSVDEWLYTYWIKGKYKKCSSCGEIKLISNERYFRKHPLGRDGFQPICRKCERFTKKGKK